MYKIKAINYKPYEYELLQDKLNQLGHLGYYCDDLSFISIFKKKDHSIYYKIDFFNPTGKNKTEKNIQKERFYDPYLENDYQPIYNKNGMYVFVGDKECDISINWNHKKNYIDDTKTYKTYNYIGVSIFALIVIIIKTFFLSTIDTFLTYGITLTYVGAIIGCLTAIYRNVCTSYFYKKMNLGIQQQSKQLKKSLIENTRKIYRVLFIIVILLVGGGLIEDLYNVKTMTANEHHFVVFEDLGIHEETQFSALKKSGFFVPHYYTALEYVNDDSLLYTKQYVMKSEEKALTLIDDFMNNPHLCQCTNIVKNGSLYYGYIDETLTTIIIQNQNIVTSVFMSFDYTNEQLQTIIQYYQ